MKRKILLIYTGGTIGMVQNAETGALEVFNFKDIYTLLPMLRLIEAHIDFYALLPLIDSADTNPNFWIRLAKLIEEKYDSYDGFVILHGTDTMSFTASALSFLLENLAKPIILTGSQLPLGVLRSDGRDNIINSIEIAASYGKNEPCVPEVCLYFDNSLFRGNRTYKDNVRTFNAFSSSNYPKLAEVGVNIKYNYDAIMPCPKDKKLKLKVHTQLDNRVAILKLYPGIRLENVEAILSVPDLKAVVMETFGSGNAPGDSAFITLLKKAIERGVVIVSVTQCKGGGAVEIGKYASSFTLGEIGVVSGFDITTEAAITKLMFLLGTNISKDELIYSMQQSLRGEMTNPQGK